jgi:hypothetical protein
MVQSAYISLTVVRSLELGSTKLQANSPVSYWLAPNYLSETTITTDYPVPTDGLTLFYFFTFDGVRTVEGKEDDMGHNRHPLSPLFHKAHDLVNAAREAAGLTDQD